MWSTDAERILSVLPFDQESSSPGPCTARRFSTPSELWVYETGAGWPGVVHMLSCYPTRFGITGCTPPVPRMADWPAHRWKLRTPRAEVGIGRGRQPRNSTAASAPSKRKDTQARTLIAAVASAALISGGLAAAGVGLAAGAAQAAPSCCRRRRLHHRERRQKALRRATPSPNAARFGAPLRG